MEHAHWIALPRIEGVSSRQAHADLPDHTFERELGREGFYGPATQMYHRHPPTAWDSVEGPLRPRALNLNHLDSLSPSPWDAHLVLSNDALRLRIWQADRSMDHLVRNGDGDELLFVHDGCGDLYCDYGHLKYSEGDYVVIPRGTLWRIEPTKPSTILMIEATNEGFQLPEKGIVGEHAVYDCGVLETPHIDEDFQVQQTDDPWTVIVKRRQTLSSVRYPFNPLDATGWHGTLIPVRLNWRDIRPLMSHRYHVPPSAHTTLVSKRFVVCTFCPRPMESDPDALKVPFFHNNDDYDEVIFYHRGEFFSRDHIEPGMMTVHPCGITHGPHPKALSAGRQRHREATNEVAMMIDARDALEIAELPPGVEWQGYVDSWKEKG